MSLLDDTAGIAINRFEGQYAFLSNFFRQEVEYEGIVYPTSEHAFQAAKTTDVKIRKLIASASSPAKAKSMGRSITKRHGWDDMKYGIMWQVLFSKFRDPVMAGLLLATGDAELIEGNTWGDVYWGKCSGEGQNHLGKLLMRVRTRLRKIVKEHL